MSWASDELSSLRLGDARRVARAIRMVERMAERPSGSIPETFETHSEAKAAYRALSSEELDAQAVRESMRQACLERLSGHELVLVVQDTTSFDLSGHSATEGLGPLANAKCSGLWMHSSLCVSADGVPLGVVDQRVWARDPGAIGKRHRRRELPLEAKESFRWIESLRALHESMPSASTMLTVADREADIFALFAEERPARSELLIRACRDRRVSGDRKLWAAVEAAPVCEEFSLTVRSGRERSARDARVQLRCCAVMLEPPSRGVHPADRKPVEVHAVLVREIDGPADGSALEWLLLTTLPVADGASARRIVGYYELRWLIERYHYVLKSGCRIEESQLRSFDRLERFLALYCVVAWRLLWVTYAARTDGQQPCTVAFTDLEWQTAYRVQHGTAVLPEHPPPPLAEMVRWVAGLGGFLGRRSDGQPGVKVLWRGLMRLHDIVIGVLLLSPETVGNG